MEINREGDIALPAGKVPAGYPYESRVYTFGAFVVTYIRIYTVFHF
jgi:hypothetical protein